MCNFQKEIASLGVHGHATRVATNSHVLWRNLADERKNTPHFLDLRQWQSRYVAPVHSEQALMRRLRLNLVSRVIPIWPVLVRYRRNLSHYDDIYARTYIRPSATSINQSMTRKTSKDFRTGYSHQMAKV